MLQLLCPDGSTLPLAAHIVIGRATSAGGLQAVAAASRQQLELWPLEDAGNAVHLKALGQNGKSQPLDGPNALLYYAVYCAACSLLKFAVCGSLDPGEERGGRLALRWHP